MKNLDHPRTSRRSFTRTIAGVIASVPFVSAFVKVEGKPRNEISLKESGSNYIQQRKTHDTPPPIEIGDGSLRIDSHEDLGQPTPSGQRFVYRRSQLPKIDHIRVLTGSSEEIYLDLDADGSTIEIQWRSDTPRASELLQVRGGTYFEIETDRPFNPRQAGTVRRPYRYQHPGPPQGGTRGFRIESVEITDRLGARTKFTAPTTGTGVNFLPEGYRVQVWRE